MNLQQRIERRERESASAANVAIVAGTCPRCRSPLFQSRAPAKAMRMIGHRCTNLTVRVVTCSARDCDYVDLPDFASAGVA